MSIKISPETLSVELQGWSLMASDVLGDELECILVILHNLFQGIHLCAESLQSEYLQHIGRGLLLLVCEHVQELEHCLPFPAALRLFPSSDLSNFEVIFPRGFP